MPRETLPERRAQWTQKARIGARPNPFYLSVGEYDDGRVGEIFIRSDKEGTFAAGILDGLARVISVSLQCGTPVAEIVKALRAINFPPQGNVDGSPVVKTATSVCDWIASELEIYVPGWTPPARGPTEGGADTSRQE